MSLEAFFDKDVLDLFAHRISIGVFRAVEISAERGGDISDVAMSDNFNNQIVAAYDIEISKPNVVDEKIAEGMYPEQARAEYAQYLIRQINALQYEIGLVMDDAESVGDNKLYNSLAREFQRLENLEEDISGGSTSMRSLKGYYNRLDKILDRAPVVTASL